jgi:hypothetical protein
MRDSDLSETFDFNSSLYDIELHDPGRCMTTLCRVEPTEIPRGAICERVSDLCGSKDHIHVDVERDGGLTKRARRWLGALTLITYES